ncbi:MAG: hypothetical protein KGI54_13830 [Pseudomonadota bacterium]|nr:hypothetical protein [Pseudomonadota bacterium]
MSHSLKHGSRFFVFPEYISYRAFYGNHQAFVTLKNRSKSNPAYLWGLSEFYALKHEKSNYYSLKHSKPGLDISDPLFDKAMGRYQYGGFYGQFHEMSNGVVSGSGKKIQKLDMKILTLLQQAVKKGDPAAENSLASEYWGEVVRPIALLSGMSSKLGQKNTIINMTLPANQRMYAIARKFCKDGFNLALKSKAAGWPDAYTNLSMHAIYPKNSADTPSGLISTSNFLAASGCAGHVVPPYHNGTELFMKAAALGSVEAISAIMADAYKDKNKKKFLMWKLKLSHLAEHGNEKAKHELLNYTKLSR